VLTGIGVVPTAVHDGLLRQGVFGVAYPIWRGVDVRAEAGSIIQR